MRSAAAWSPRDVALATLTAALLVHATLVAIAVGFVLLILPVLVQQIGSLWSSIPDLYASLRGQMLASDSTTLQRAAAALPDSFDPAGGASLDSLSMALAGLG